MYIGICKAGRIGGVDGADGWEGAILLYSLLRALISAIAGVIPGQKNDFSALEVI